MKLRALEAFALTFAGISVLAITAYVLERKKRELDAAVDGYFAPVGYVTEGSDPEFKVQGTFGLTAAAIQRAQPNKV